MTKVKKIDKHEARKEEQSRNIVAYRFVGPVL